MRLDVVSDPPWEQRADVLAVAVPNDRQLPAYVAEVDRRLGGAIEAMRTLGAVKGALWEARLIPGRDMGARFVLAVGVADAQALDRTGARRLGGVILRRLMGCDVRHLAIHVPDLLLERGGVTPAGFVEQLVRGVVEGAEEPSTIYLDATDKLPPALEDLTLVVESGDDDALLLRAERGQTIGLGTNRARRLAQRAANDVSPEVLADEASMIAQRFGMQLTVIGPEEAARMGMGMFMAVGRGSANQPRFIALRSAADTARDSRDRLVALVGKGVTFDSGGISIKPSERMEDMKMDKTGACTVLHAMATVAQLAPGLPLLAVAPAVENMPGAHSTRPGDVVTALNGKSVEVTNTDAEGRLILGDAMTWAERQGATHIVDVATLTGAVSRALGRSMTGGFATDDGLWADMASAARRQGEPLWRLPIVDDYRSDMDSPYADLVNSGSAEGSLVKSAVFLREFVTRPWVHLDIAGSAYIHKDATWAARGATGAMHAALVELCVDGTTGHASTRGEEDPGPSSGPTT